MLGLEEFGAKPGLKDKKKEDLMDASLVEELDKSGFIKQLYEQK
jgi:hypothetical protein